MFMSISLVVTALAESEPLLRQHGRVVAPLPRILNRDRDQDAATVEMVRRPKSRPHLIIYAECLAVEL